MEFRADLHCHSSCSDGTYSPAELVRLAVDIGLSGLSITDHDSVDAYEEAQPIADLLGLKLLPGIEFSSSHNDKSVHVLGYGIQVKHEAIQALCRKHKHRRAERNAQILTKLAALGYPIAFEEVCTREEHHTLGRPHIALAMVKKGYVENIQDAFKKFLGEHRPAFAKGEMITMEETLETIHSAGGKAVIAHPHLIVDNALFKQLLTLPFDGIECYYAKFTPAQNSRFLKIASDKKWLITGGSDFHGSVKPMIPLGASWVDRTAWDLLTAS